eukprot:2381641-Alexandrium_andersonii.AAC.1
MLAHLRTRSQARAPECRAERGHVYSMLLRLQVLLIVIDMPCWRLSRLERNGAHTSSCGEASCIVASHFPRE